MFCIRQLVDPEKEKRLKIVFFNFDHIVNRKIVLSREVALINMWWNQFYSSINPIAHTNPPSFIRVRYSKNLSVPI